MNRKERRHPEPPAPLMSILDTAAYLGLTDRTIRTMISDGRLRAYKIGGKLVRLRRDEIDAAMTPIGARIGGDAA